MVLLGGDTYLLEPSQIEYLGDRLLQIPHVQRFRFASKGLSVSPSRLIDPEDTWVDTIIRLQQRARKMGKHVCVHTHFNNSREISWITRLGAQRLYEAGVTVRNQSVLLNGINNSVEELLSLVLELAKMNIEPVSLTTHSLLSCFPLLLFLFQCSAESTFPRNKYYVYQGDMIPGAEDLRTPLSDSLYLEHQIKDQIAGFLSPDSSMMFQVQANAILSRHRIMIDS